jgi:glutamine amidotransferase
MISLVNYGLGNIQAFQNIYSRLNFDVQIASTPDELLRADKIILPGVGAFDWAMSRLDQSGLRPTLDEMVLQKKIPVLGICVGMQMMAQKSEEGVLSGLGWIDAEVKKMSIDNGKSLNTKYTLPHMGWNDVSLSKDHSLFKNIKSPLFYFLHSYVFVPSDSSDTLATTVYNNTFTSAACRDHIFGVQFHPEKSHDNGVQLLKNFAEL